MKQLENGKACGQGRGNKHMERFQAVFAIYSSKCLVLSIFFSYLKSTTG
jgi:hypothetical protein